MKIEQSVPKRRHIKFRRRKIAQKKAYNIQNRQKFEIKNIITCYVYFVLCCCGDQRTSIYTLTKVNVAEAVVLAIFQSTDL
jgi:hypothetical protein